MVQHDRNKLLYTDDNSIAENEVLNGLLAAKQHERNNTKLSPSTQQKLLDANFPRLPDGDDAKRLTEDECLHLRASMQDVANERTTRSIANLREQLAEYHSLLEELSWVTARYEALEKTCQERGYRIQELEQEVEGLKGGRRCAASTRRRVSCAEAQATRGGGGGNHAPVISGQAPLKAEQGMRGSTAYCQPSSFHRSSTNAKPQVRSKAVRVNKSRREPYRQTQNPSYGV